MTDTPIRPSLFTRVHASEDRIVSMIEYQGRLIVATERHVFQLIGDRLVQLQIVTEDSLAAERLAKAQAIAAAPDPFDQKAQTPPPPKPARKKREPKAEAPPTARREPAAEKPSTAAQAQRRTDLAVRSAQRRGWKLVTEAWRVPTGATRRTVAGVQMWRAK